MLTERERVTLTEALVEKWETPVTDPVFPSLFECAELIFEDELQAVYIYHSSEDIRAHGRRVLAMRGTLDIIHRA